MDNFAYRNWQGGNNENSYDDSTENYGYDSSQRRSSTSNFRSGKEPKKDEYEFDISQDDDYLDYSDHSRHSQKKRQSISTSKTVDKNPIVTSSTRRSSINDRAKEILERNKAVGRSSGIVENTERLSSYKSTLADLMEGITVPDVVSKRAATEGSTKNEMKKRVESPTFAMSPGDSFEMSATDLEVCSSYSTWHC